MIEWPKKVYENIKVPFIKTAVKLNISANQLTVLNHVITLVFGCYFFSRGTYLFYLGGLAVCLINGLLDYLDGDLARINKQAGNLGEWLDTGFDVVIQNAVLGAIGIGCYVQGMPAYWIVLFFIGNSANNFVSFYYNQKFGFESNNGNAMFRELMETSPKLFNKIIKQMLDPTCDYLALGLYTYRYWVALGAVLNIMPAVFLTMTVIANVKWFVMYTIYALYLKGSENLHILQVLKTLDDEQTEYYQKRVLGS